VTTISFDIAGLELFLPLTTGAKLVIADRDEVADGFRLLQHLELEGVTVMQATPSTWRLLLEAGFQPKPGFKMLCGGEALPADVAHRLAQGAGILWNMYGPTETTIWSSCGRIGAAEAVITVGTPIANTQFYVLDRNDQPVPLGVPGQLHIGGDGVARGYYKRADLTQEKFVANRYGPGRLYRTAIWRAGCRMGGCRCWAGSTRRSNCVASASNWAKSSRCSPPKVKSPQRLWRCAPTWARPADWSAITLINRAIRARRAAGVGAGAEPA